MTWELFKHALFPSGEGSTIVTFLYWIVLVLFAGLEFLAPQLEGVNRSHRWPVNFGLGLINMAVAPLVPISTLWASLWAERHGIGLLNLLDGSGWIFALIATIAVQSFAGYALHRFSHSTPWLWRLHRVHHFDVAVDVSTGLRHHPLELLLSLLIYIPLAIIFGLSPLALMIYGAADAMFALFSHANIRLPARLEHPLRSILVTPRIHAVHHSSHEAETDSNFGAVFTIWDRLFGTFCDRRADRPNNIQFGLAELQDERASDLLWQLKSPLCSMKKVTTLVRQRAKVEALESATPGADNPP